MPPPMPLPAAASAGRLPPDRGGACGLAGRRAGRRPADLQRRRRRRAGGGGGGLPSGLASFARRLAATAAAGSPAGRAAALPRQPAAGRRRLRPARFGTPTAPAMPLPPASPTPLPLARTCAARPDAARRLPPPPSPFQVRPFSGAPAAPLAVGGELDLDVAPRGVRLRADLVSLGNDLLGLLGVGDPRQLDVEVDGDVVAAAVLGDQAHLRVDLDVAKLDLPPPRDHAKRPLEAGGVADRKELLRVGAATGSAGLLRLAEVDDEGAIVCLAMALLPAALDLCLSCVDRLGHRAPFRFPGCRVLRPRVSRNGCARGVRTVPNLGLDGATPPRPRPKPFHRARRPLV